MPFDALPTRQRTSPAENVLAYAKQLISEPCLWCKRRPYQWFGLQRCLMTALIDAGNRDLSGRYLARKAVHEALHMRGWSDPVRFNDHPGTSHKDIMELLDDAMTIAAMKERG